MNANFQSIRADGSARPAGFGQAAASRTALQWAALSDAANVVAVLAGFQPEPDAPAIRNFPALLRDAAAWQREQARNGIADLLEVMEPGISALMAINARGADPSAAARALWHEFTDARSALLALLPPSGTMGPRRSA